MRQPEVINGVAITSIGLLLEMKPSFLPPNYLIQPDLQQLADRLTLLNNSSQRLLLITAIDIAKFCDEKSVIDGDLPVFAFKSTIDQEIGHISINDRNCIFQMISRNFAMRKLALKGYENKCLLSDPSPIERVSWHNSNEVRAILGKEFNCLLVNNLARNRNQLKYSDEDRKQSVFSLNHLLSCLGTIRKGGLLWLNFEVSTVIDDEYSASPALHSKFDRVQLPIALNYFLGLLDELSKVAHQAGITQTKRDEDNLCRTAMQKRVVKSVDNATALFGANVSRETSLAAFDLKKHGSISNATLTKSLHDKECLHKHPRIIISGARGAGKSTLLNELIYDRIVRNENILNKAIRDIAGRETTKVRAMDGGNICCNGADLKREQLMPLQRQQPHIFILTQTSQARYELRMRDYFLTRLRTVDGINLGELTKKLNDYMGRLKLIAPEQLIKCLIDIQQSKISWVKKVIGGLSNNLQQRGDEWNLLRPLVVVDEVSSFPANFIQQIAKASGETLMPSEANKVEINMPARNALIKEGGGFDFIFCGTTDGYEGQGQSTKKLIDALCSSANKRSIAGLENADKDKSLTKDAIKPYQMHHLVLTAQWRHAADDLLAKASAIICQPCKYQMGGYLRDNLSVSHELTLRGSKSISTIEYYTIKPSCIINPRWLFEIYGLLQKEHYRTSPNDLGGLLTETAELHLLCQVDGRDRGAREHIYDIQIICCALCLDEAFVSESLGDMREIIQGTRRPKGNLILQNLLSTYGNDVVSEQIKTFHVKRISRIATLKSKQRKGHATHLLGLIESTSQANKFLQNKVLNTQLVIKAEYLAVSFGVEHNNLRFWLSNGFEPLKIGFSKNKWQGQSNVLMIRKKTMFSPKFTPKFSGINPENNTDKHKSTINISWLKSGGLGFAKIMDANARLPGLALTSYAVNKQLLVGEQLLDHFINAFRITWMHYNKEYQQTLPCICYDMLDEFITDKCRYPQASGKNTPPEISITWAVGQYNSTLLGSDVLKQCDGTVQALFSMDQLNVALKQVRDQHRDLTWLAPFVSLLFSNMVARNQAENTANKQLREQQEKNHKLKRVPRMTKLEKQQFASTLLHDIESLLRSRR